MERTFNKKQKTANGGADSDVKTIHIAGLSWSATEDAVREHFSECGEITNVRLPLRDDGKLKGFGFVDFATADAAQKALELDSTSLLDRSIKITLSTGGGGDSQKKAFEPRAPTQKPDGCTTVWVGNLAWGATEDDLYAAFEDCGEITSVRLATDRDTGKPRGFGHVEFAETESSDKAVAKAGTLVGGREIRVDFAGGKEGGGGGGRGGGSCGKHTRHGGGGSRQRTNANRRCGVRVRAVKGEHAGRNRSRCVVNAATEGIARGRKSRPRDSASGVSPMSGVALSFASRLIAKRRVNAADLINV